MIRVGKYDWQNDIQPTTLDFENVLVHTDDALSPYKLKNEQGQIMENVWQYSKAWPVTFQTRQSISKYNHAVRWEYPGGERHLVENWKDVDRNDFAAAVTLDYWKWRSKGENWPRWVRRPMGFKPHSLCVGSVYNDPETGKVRLLDYIEARKRIYYPCYRDSAVKKRAFRTLQQKLENGVNIQINEVDGPRYDSKVHPFDKVEQESLLVDEQILRDWINEPSQPFGHGAALAAALLGIDQF